jgi:hypothetical protein
MDEGGVMIGPSRHAPHLLQLGYDVLGDLVESGPACPSPSTSTTRCSQPLGMRSTSLDGSPAAAHAAP